MTKPNRPMLSSWSSSTSITPAHGRKQASKPARTGGGPRQKPHPLRRALVANPARAARNVDAHAQRW